ncbi:GyrI-like domain-containing protein [Mucilaginibacter sp. SP1R1]|uniref:GyrI-like domain-containing protein n=1 Tax=Mucilaginibacter sp. SP1R1 TaxID=2723091 RepID=UPI0016076BE3|nr:GyrI-like domain-containing protein [Mucilaginibacter sp. SP1R1]MBB6151672.1 effector-binding domain-containing protein [Mucilaginibacter sp. SP1R1]
MKKAVIVLFLLIIIGFIPFQQHSSVLIKSNYFDVCQQLNSPDNWKRWQTDIHNQLDKAHTVKTDTTGFLINIPGRAFSVKNTDGNKFNVMISSNHIDHHYYYTVMPGALPYSNTTILIDFKTNVGRWLLSQFTVSDNTVVIQQLKAFMEDARLYYGFNINQKNVAESYIAVKKEIIPAKNKYPEMVKAATELHSFIAQNNIEATQALSGAYYTQKADSLQIMIGIPVNRQVNSTGCITFMHMPGGKMLVGDYTGKYSDRQKIYNAMEKYLQDHNLLKQIAPFERYLDNKVPSGDKDIVNMQVNYPVL